MAITEAQADQIETALKSAAAEVGVQSVIAIRWTDSEVTVTDGAGRCIGGAITRIWRVETWITDARSGNIITRTITDPLPDAVALMRGMARELREARKKTAAAIRRERAAT